MHAKLPAAVSPATVHTSQTDQPGLSTSSMNHTLRHIPWLKQSIQQGLTYADTKEKRWDESEGQIKVEQGPLWVSGAGLEHAIEGAADSAD